MNRLPALLKSALACAALSVAFMSAPANAVIVLGPGSTTCTSNQTSNLSLTEVEALVSSCFGLDATLVQAYKSDVGGGDSGPFADSYDTTFLNEPLDPADALIEWISGTPAIDCPYCFLIVKDGNQEPAQYIIPLGLWDGMETLELLGFWPNQGAISHVEIVTGTLDTPCEPTNPFCLEEDVPEPGTLALLGIGALGLALRRRWMA